MNFQTVLYHILAVIETAALIGALVYYTRAMHEKKLKRKQQGKKGARSHEEVDRAIALYKRNAMVSITIYLFLNILRRFNYFLP